MYLGIDLGTSAVKLLLLNSKQQILAEASVALTVHRPEHFGLEQEPKPGGRLFKPASRNFVSNIHWLRLKALASLGRCMELRCRRSATGFATSNPLDDGRSNTEVKILERQIPNSRQITGNLAMPVYCAQVTLAETRRACTI